MKYLELLGKFRDYYLTIARRKAIELVRSESNAAIFDIHNSRLEGTGICLNGSLNTQMVATFAIGESLIEGVKILDLEGVDFDSLEDIEINVSVEDYTQPFPTVVIKIPESYAKRFKNLEEPQFVILHHDSKLNVIITTVILKRVETLLKVYGLVLLNDFPTVEKAMSHVVGEEMFRDSDDIGKLEKHDYRSLIRACLNLCLLVDEFGLKRVGPENPGFVNQLTRIRDRVKEPERRRKAQEQINKEPIIYSFAREVKLSPPVPRIKGEGSNDKLLIDPHWRRAHFRMQPCGPGRTERKRIRIERMFIGKKRFGGDASETSTTYT